MASTKAKKSAKRTYSIDAAMLVRFENLVPPGQRSSTVEELVTQRVEEIEAKKLRALIHEGLDYMADVYKEVKDDWSAVDSEGWPAQ